MQRRLGDNEVARALDGLPGWERQGNLIARTFDCSSFRGSIAFVGTLSDLAERAGHHPDIDIRYARVRVMLTTHDAGGVTEADIALARQITAAAAER